MNAGLQRALFGGLASMGMPSVIRRRHADKASILMYHSIVDAPPMVWTQVHVDEFRKQMRYLAASATPLTMSALLDRFASGDLPPDAAAVTFDDGFANFKSLALPILEEYGVPATLYVTTSFMDGASDFGGFIWTDYIHALLLSTADRTVEVPGLELPPLPLSTPPTRHRAKSILCAALKKLPTRDRLQAIAALADRLDTAILPELEGTFRGLSWNDVQELDRNPLVEIGSHTLTHVILSRSSTAEIEQELLESKRILAGHVGHDIDHFAYPNGSREDYDERTLDLVGRSYRSAVTTVEGLAARTASPFELPRLGIGSDMFFSKFQLFVSGLMEGRT